MRILFIISFLGSLLTLVSCSSSESTSTINVQSNLLVQFGAALQKSVSIEGHGVETINLNSDSVEWKKELEFLAPIDQLHDNNFYVQTEYGKDSSVVHAIYTPRDSSNLIKHVDLRNKGNQTIYEYSIAKSKLTQTSDQHVRVVFKNYQEQKIINSYTVKGHQSSPASDSIFYSIEGKIKY